MKVQIRKGVFETNSSSVHTLTLCTKELYDKWVNGDALYDSYNDVIEDFATDSCNSYDIETVRQVYEEQRANCPWMVEWEKLNTKTIKAFKHKLTIQNLKRNNNEQYQDYDSYTASVSARGLETFHQEMTTPKGEKVIAFGYHGYD